MLHHEFARQLCAANHEFHDGPVPCGHHRRQADLYYPLTKTSGTVTFELIARVRLDERHEAESEWTDDETRS